MLSFKVKSKKANVVSEENLSIMKSQFSIILIGIKVYLTCKNN